MEVKAIVVSLGLALVLFAGSSQTLADEMLPSDITKRSWTAAHWVMSGVFGRRVRSRALWNFP